MNKIIYNNVSFGDFMFGHGCQIDNQGKPQGHYSFHKQSAIICEKHTQSILVTTISRFIHFSSIRKSKDLSYNINLSLEITKSICLKCSWLSEGQMNFQTFFLLCWSEFWEDWEGRTAHLWVQNAVNWLQPLNNAWCVWNWWFFLIRCDPSARLTDPSLSPACSYRLTVQQQRCGVACPPVYNHGTSE